MKYVKVIIIILAGLFAQGMQRGAGPAAVNGDSSKRHDEADSPDKLSKQV